jgi:hypothetical protein
MTTFFIWSLLFKNQRNWIRIVTTNIELYYMKYFQHLHETNQNITHEKVKIRHKHWWSDYVYLTHWSSRFLFLMKESRNISSNVLLHRWRQQKKVWKTFSIDYWEETKKYSKHTSQKLLDNWTTVIGDF